MSGSPLCHAGSPAQCSFWAPLRMRITSSWCKRAAQVGAGQLFTHADEAPHACRAVLGSSENRRVLHVHPQRLCTGGTLSLPCQGPAMQAVISTIGWCSPVG